MPPKAKITKNMILNTILDITRENGFDAVNARSIAAKLQCSTRPIFTCYENMEELKKDFLDFSYKLYIQFVTDYSNSATVSPYLFLPLSYIEFAKTEPFLFKLLFINDMTLDMKEPTDFYKEIDNEERATAFSNMIGMDLDSSKRIFFNLFIYFHGIAVLTTTKKILLAEKDMESMIMNVLVALIKQEKPDWRPSF